MIRGIWKPKSHTALIARAKFLYRTLTNQMNVKWKWVKGHTGDAGNERADYLADQAKLGLLRTGGIGPDSPYKFFQGIAPPSIIPPSQDQNTDDAFTSFINNIHAATDQTLPTIKATPRRPWISTITLDLIEQEKCPD